MSCNPTRIELSNDAETSVEFTVTPAPDPVVDVYFDVPGLSIDTATTLSAGGSATVAIPAVSADTNAIFDASIQVGTNPAVAADVQIVDTSSAQSVGVNINSDGVTYCAATGADDLATWTGSTNVTTLGTISTGTWSATTIAVDKGGTGATTEAAARTSLEITNLGSYTGQIETVAEKTYVLDAYVPAAVTITRVRAYTDSGSVTVELKNGISQVKSWTADSSSTGDQTGLTSTSVSAGASLTLVTTSNSSALDLVFVVEYSE